MFFGVMWKIVLISNTTKKTAIYFSKSISKSILEQHYNTNALRMAKPYCKVVFKSAKNLEAIRSLTNNDFPL